jgi:GT2 family glycosyltransferase
LEELVSEGILIVIPTLKKELGESVGRMALATAGCSVPVRVVVVHDVKRQGFTKTVNIGMRQVKVSEDVCLLNDDVTQFQWNWLEILRQVLYSNSKYGLTGPSGNCGVPQIAQAGLGGSGVEALPHISFWCVLMKRSMLDDLGLLDEAYIHYNSDSEYCVRMQRSGWLAIWVKSVWLKHTKHGSGKKTKWRDHDIRVYRDRK